MVKPTCGNPSDGGPKSLRIGLNDCIVAMEDGEGMFPVKSEQYKSFTVWNNNFWFT